MDNNVFSYLNFIDFSQLNLWDFKRYTTRIVDSKFPIVKLSDYIQEENSKIKPFENPEEEYEILGVNNKTGLFDAYIEKGSNINQPYKIVKNGFLAYNPYRINVGSIGLKTDEQKYNYISPAYVVLSCKEGLLPEFLYILFRANKFNELIRENTTGSVRQTLSFSSMGQIKIPLPPTKIQQEIVDRYNAKIKIAEEQEKEAYNIEKELELVLFKELQIENIEINNKTERKSIFTFTNLYNLSRWGVEYLKNNLCNANLLQSKNIPMVELKNIVEIDPKNNFADLDSNMKMSFLPMPCISDIFGEVINQEEGINYKSKGYTRFQNGDLLWAKITPCMQNGKSAIVKNLTNGYGYGSTEYFVIRNKNSDKVRLDFIYHILRTQKVREAATKYFTGSSGQQRVPKSFLEDLQIPLPSYEQQKQISDKIYKMKDKKKKLLFSAEQNRQFAQQEFEKELFE